MNIASLDFLIAAWVFVFGAIIGSFLNVVIYRYNSGASLGGRSMCFTCGRTLHWYELVPILSYLLQRGKCRNCHSRISVQYPLVEAVTGLLFVGAFFVAQGYISFAYLIVQFSLLIVIGAYDIRHKIIPDLFSYMFAALALVYLLYEQYLLGWQWDMLWPDLLSGPIYFLPFALLWFVSRGRWMGFGDAKLALGIGWFLGLAHAYMSMLLAFWIGSIVGLLLILKDNYSAFSNKERAFTMKSEIPFGPFLILGLLITLFFNEWIEMVIGGFMYML